MVAAIAVCAAGITVAQRSQPETAIPTIGMVEQAPVIILDAGHGESTKTEFIKHERYILAGNPVRMFSYMNWPHNF